MPLPAPALQRRYLLVSFPVSSPSSAAPDRGGGHSRRCPPAHAMGQARRRALVEAFGTLVETPQTGWTSSSDPTWDRNAHILVPPINSDGPEDIDGALTSRNAPPERRPRLRSE